MNLFEVERERPPILGFFGEYRFLSNYHLCTCLMYDIPFKSSEHAYMYQKSFDTRYRQGIINAATPKEANWSDTYWGVCEGVGENNLGKMLMDIRSTCYN